MASLAENTDSVAPDDDSDGIPITEMPIEADDEPHRPRRQFKELLAGLDPAVAAEVQKFAESFAAAARRKERRRHERELTVAVDAAVAATIQRMRGTSNV